DRRAGECHTAAAGLAAGDGSTGGSRQRGAQREYGPSVYMALLPYAGYNVTTGAGTSTAIGSVSRYLGILAATLERWDHAAEHFEQALPSLASKAQTWLAMVQT